jgi:hypothetical protein
LSHGTFHFALDAWGSNTNHHLAGSDASLNERLAGQIDRPLPFAPKSSGRASQYRDKAMNRSNLFLLVIGALVVIASVLGYQLYQDRKQPQGVQILLGPNGVSIEKN